MSEIHNDGIKFNARKDISFKGQNKQPIQEEKKPVETVNSDDLTKNPTEYIGRSQVKKLNKPVSAKNLEQYVVDDLKVLRENPELVFKSDELFEKALEAGKSYPEAIAIQAGFVEEMKS